MVVALVGLQGEELASYNDNSLLLLLLNSFFESSERDFDKMMIVDPVIFVYFMYTYI